MWNVASTTNALSQVYGNIGAILLVVIGGIIVGTVALMGLGFGIRKLRFYIYTSGNGFISDPEYRAWVKKNDSF